MTKMEQPVFDKFNSATNYSLRILRAIEIIENRKLCWKVSKTYLKTSCNSKCDEFNIIAPNGRDKSTPQAACENLFVDRIATSNRATFRQSNNATSLTKDSSRHWNVESCLSQQKPSRKNPAVPDAPTKTFRDRWGLSPIRSRPCPEPAARYFKYSASLAFAVPLRSRYSELLTLGIPRVKSSLSLTVFTQLRRREASRLEWGLSFHVYTAFRPITVPEIARCT